MSAVEIQRLKQVAELRSMIEEGGKSKGGETDKEGQSRLMGGGCDFPLKHRAHVRLTRNCSLAKIAANRCEAMSGVAFCKSRIQGLQ